MLIGYARVSTQDQDLQLQLDALQGAGCERIFTDKASGSQKDRPGLNDALAFARPGDALCVWKLDRLSRSVKQLVDLSAALERREIDLKSITDGIDTKGAAGRFFFHIMAALAEMERELNRERTLAGLKAAKQAGRVGGRKPKMNNSKTSIALTLLASGTPAKDVADTLGVSVATLYRYCPAASRAVSDASSVES
ncbi:recombinase family protein [Cellvibrio sp. OA-2007]|uniref:recombinase family protein n=1 Tax=Cellvibrio sp. OA-2007 TaxID=529823 RepID=UPI000782737F|nr:recombinase family protein [Cellvibrio sp. OA-2007]